MVRWRLLATGWRTVQELDLILGASSQTKVFQLIWTGPKSKFPYLRRTQWVCILWILLNIVITILVAIFGLTYSMDNSQAWVRTRSGYVTTANLSIIRHQNNNGDITQASQNGAAQTFGVAGEDYSTTDLTTGNTAYLQTIYRKSVEEQDRWYVIFTDRNANQSLVAQPSDRAVETAATCRQYDIIEDVIPDDQTGRFNITYADQLSHGGTTLQAIKGYSPGLTTYILADKCGHRCASLSVYQAANRTKALPTSSFFQCNSTVSTLRLVRYNGSSVTVSDDDYDEDTWHEFPNVTAQIWAGAIASNGLVNVDAFNHQWQTYNGNSQFSDPSKPLTATDAEIAVAKFTAYALAAYDDHGTMMNVWGVQPLASLQLDVDWGYAITILITIPLLQFLAYFIVISWANQVNIKDDSFLSIAKFLQPLIEKLPRDGGCFLTGDEIAKRPEFRGTKVAYGFENDSSAGHVDGNDDDKPMRHLGLIFQKPPGNYQTELKRKFPDGWYT